MIDLNYKENNNELYGLKEIIKCKMPDGRLCIAEGFTQALLDNTNAIILIWDLKGNLIKINSFGQETSGFSEYEIIGNKWKNRLISNEYVEKTLQVFEKLRDGVIPTCHETPILMSNGEKRNVLWSNCIINDKSQRPYLGVSIGTDVTEKKRAEETIRKMELYDSVTGLPNRTMFIRELNLAIYNAAENETAILFIDLDNFKAINDTFGHIKGDELLRKIGKLIQEIAGGEMVAAHLGGDEFAVIMPRISDIAEAVHLGSKICETIGAPSLIDGKNMHITASVGIAAYKDDTSDSETLIKRADIALYNAKNNGKNQVKLYYSYMEDSFLERLEIENGLRSALRNNEFMLYYQPQVDIESGTIIGMEALIRWKHPVKGLIPPDKFIPIAEESGMIFEIGNWVLRTALSQIKIWQDKGYNKLKVAINISSKQFENTDFINRVYKKISDIGIDPKWIEFEITERTAMEDFDYTLRILNNLKKLNISVALDDFGTGYSSLNYLNKLPVDKLKIDKSFLDNISYGSSEEYIAKSIIGLASHLELTVVAEGVETINQIVFLRENKCKNVQGYYFSKPLPAEEFEELIKVDKKFIVQ